MIHAKWPLAIDALDACWSLLVQDPIQAGVEVPGCSDMFIATTPRLRLRPALRILYMVEREAGRVTLLRVDTK